MSRPQPTLSEQLGVRLPEGTKDRLHEAAVADKRTVTSWVQKVLLEALEADERRRGEAG
jgi:predicted HicB family RNase H-like nuclease